MPAPLTLTVNGESRRTTATTVAALVRELGLVPEKVAVERNGEIAPRSTLAEVALADGDTLEIVHFVGGGVHISPLPLRERVGRGVRREAGARAADPSPPAPCGAPSSPSGGEE
jgi:thiamine biosynthesis protein ThiS